MKKISSFLVVFLLMMTSFSAAGQGCLRGDVDGDNEVDIADVSAIIDFLLKGDSAIINMENANCDRDEKVGIADVSALIDYLLSG